MYDLYVMQLESSSQTDLVKRTSRTFPQSSFWSFNPLLHIVWPLIKEYTIYHPGYIAQFRVATKDFRVNPVSFDMFKHFMEISSLPAYNYFQDLVHVPPSNLITTQAQAGLLMTWIYWTHGI